LSVRLVLAVAVAALTCTIGALILGEYEFTGVTPIGAGVLFGLVISEMVLEIGRRRHPVLGVLTAAMVAGALGWAGYVSSGRGLRPFPNGAWVAMAFGAITAGIRTGRWRSARGDVTAAD
jgi:hypothetical protein